MKWISSFYASTLILLLGGSVSHVAQAKEKVGLATKLHEAKDKMCIFLKKSREDQFHILSDFVERHDEAELKETMCAEASKRKAIQKFLSDSDVFSCSCAEEEDMSVCDNDVDVVLMAKKTLSTESRCNDEIDKEVALIKKHGGRALRGGVHRDLNPLIVAFVMACILIVMYMILSAVADAVAEAVNDAVEGSKDEGEEGEEVGGEEGDGE